VPALPSIAALFGTPLRGLAAALVLLAAGGCATVPPPPAPPEPVPAEEALPRVLQLDAGLELQSTLDARGQEIYTCRQVPDGLVWVDRGSEATLVDATRRTAGLLASGHYRLGDDGIALVEQVQAEVRVRDDALDWRLSRVSRASGSRGAGPLAQVSAIRRVQTWGGLPPSDSCDLDGRTLFVPFGAVYQFYRDPTLPMVAAPALVPTNPAKAAVPRRRAGPRRMLASAGAVAARPAAAAAAPGSTAEANLAGAMAGVLSDMRSGAQGKGESATGFIPLPSH